MIKKVQNIFYVVGAVILGFITFTMYQQHTPIPIFVPEITMEELDTRAAAAKQTEERVAANTRARKLVACSVDDDCIIVDKDPCGCVRGPQGVMAINVEQVGDFASQTNAVTVNCPDREPSTEAQCSPQARPVCRERVCTIVY